jgi:hypothetical protein
MSYADDQKSKCMTLIQLPPLLGLVLVVSACTSLKPQAASPDPIVIGSSQFCSVAQDKVSYIGKELVLSGSYVTDMRHYSMLRALCGGKETGFSIGYGPPQLTLSDPRIREKCEFGCHIVVNAVVTGRLVERDGGIDLDFSKMVLPDDLER